MGPFETIDLNAPGGMVDYCERYGELYYEMAQTQLPRRWDEALVRRGAPLVQEKIALEAERDGSLWRAALRSPRAWTARRTPPCCLGSSSRSASAPQIRKGSRSSASDSS